MEAVAWWRGQIKVAVLFQPHWPWSAAPVSLVDLSADEELKAAKVEMFGVGAFCLSSRPGCLQSVTDDHRPVGCSSLE